VRCGRKKHGISFKRGIEPCTQYSNPYSIAFQLSINVNSSAKVPRCFVRAKLRRLFHLKSVRNRNSPAWKFLAGGIWATAKTTTTKDEGRSPRPYSIDCQKSPSHHGFLYEGPRHEADSIWRGTDGIDVRATKDQPPSTRERI
jgi:hypothetical protein